MAKFVRLKLWRKIAKMGGGSLSEIVETTGWGYHSAKCALTRMRKDGCVIWVDGRWYTTPLAPVDGQGSAPGSLANLIANRESWRERLDKANAVRLAMIASGELKIAVPYRKRTRRKHNEIVGSTPHILDQCFGLVSLPGKFDARAANGVKSTPEGRSSPVRNASPDEEAA